MDRIRRQKKAKTQLEFRPIPQTGRRLVMNDSLERRPVSRRPPKWAAVVHLQQVRRNREVRFQIRLFTNRQRGESLLIWVYNQNQKEILTLQLSPIPLPLRLTILTGATKVLSVFRGQAQHPMEIRRPRKTTSPPSKVKSTFIFRLLFLGCRYTNIKKLYTYTPRAIALYQWRLNAWAHRGTTLGASK